MRSSPRSNRCIGPGRCSRYAFYIGHVIVLLFTIAVAFLILGLTLATFNRSMGRMPERRGARPPAAASGPSGGTGRTARQPGRESLFWPSSTFELDERGMRTIAERWTAVNLPCERDVPWVLAEIAVPEAVARPAASRGSRCRRWLLA